MKISDNLETTSGMHVFETPEDLIINSQVYDKFTMEPKPYNFFNINTLLNKNLLLHQVNILEYNIVNPSKEPNYNYYIQDSQDSSIFYCLLEVGKTDQNQYLHKIQKKNNKYTLLKSVSPDSGIRVAGNYVTNFHYKIIEQTEKHILLIQVNGGSEAGGAKGAYWYTAPGYTGTLIENLDYIIINKNDMSSSFISLGKTNKQEVFYIKKDNVGNIFTLEFFQGKFSISKINVNNSSRSVLYTNDSYNDISFVGISNIILYKNKYYIITGNYNNGPRRYMFSFQFSDINTVINTKIEELNTSSLLSWFTKNDRNDWMGSSWIRFSLKNINDDYIHMTVHNNQNLSNGYSYRAPSYAFYFSTYQFPYFTNQTYTHATNGHHRHYLLKQNNNNTWSIKSTIQPLNEEQFIYGVLYFDNLTPIFHLQTGIEIYRLDLENETYNKVFESPGTFQTIGLDENNNFYTFDVNNNCQIYNRNSCSTLNGRFEYDTYNYDNEDIETNVTIASKNFIGELIASKIHVELSGNCKFRNGKQEATLNTRLDLEYEVPVIITGPGVVYCNINEVE